MILSASDALEEISDLDWSEDKVKRKLDAIETAIRQYTNNHFQNRAVRLTAASSGNVLCASSPFLRVGDTVEISQSGVNDGVYAVNEVSETAITLDKPLYSVGHNLVTKVEYPADIVDCALRLLEWDIENEGREGIASESLSRHSVSYVQRTDENTVSGYPVGLFSMVKKYRRLRF